MQIETKRSPKKGPQFTDKSVHEKPNSVQRCQFRCLNQFEKGTLKIVTGRRIGHMSQSITIKLTLQTKENKPNKSGENHRVTLRNALCDSTNPLVKSSRRRRKKAPKIFFKKRTPFRSHSVTCTWGGTSDRNSFDHEYYIHDQFN